MDRRLSLLFASILALSSCVIGTIDSSDATSSVPGSESGVSEDSSLPPESSSSIEESTDVSSTQTEDEPQPATSESDSLSSEEDSTTISTYSEDSPISVDSEGTDSSADLVQSTLTLNDDNGKITGSYGVERTVTALDSNNQSVTIGYADCMTSTTSGYTYAQMKKSSGRIYNKTPLALRSFTITFSTSDNVKMEFSQTANFETATQFSQKITSGTAYSVGGDYGYFRLSSGSNVVYLRSIVITYGGEPNPYDDTGSSSGGSSSSSGSIPAGEDAEHYYDHVSATKTGAALKTELASLIDDHINNGYDFAYSAYPTTDVDDEGKIIDIYSSYRFDPYSDHQGAPGKGNYDQEGQMFNREHTIPQSVIGSGVPKADLHHLLPTDAYVNNRRSNYPHAEVGSATYTSTNGTKVGSSSTTGYSGTACEVPDEYKGDIARIYFYMVTRYESSLRSWDSYAAFDGNAYPGLSGWAIALYLSWHEQDPVSEKETRRNNAIYAYQKNRNPFVDHPEYATRIWGTPAD